MLKLGKILDIDVSLHWTLFLLIGWTALSAPMGSMLASVALISCVFGCVLLHEFGHCLAARQFGIGTSSIVLLPIGGVASLDRMPRDPKQELWVAVAGPLVNVVIASLLFAIHGPILELSPVAGAWLGSLMYINIGLVVFNMLPAFPMDGGRVLRAISAMFMPYVKATNLAASVGRVVAVLLGLVGLVNANIVLMLIAGFVYFVGSAEARAVASDPLNYATPKKKAKLSDGKVFRVIRDGITVNVIWDDHAQVYRYVS